MKIGDIIEYKDLCKFGSTCLYCDAVRETKSLYWYEYKCGLAINEHPNNLGMSNSGLMKFVIMGLCSGNSRNYNESQTDKEICICDLFSVLMITGCKCGAIENERKMKQNV